MGYKAIDEGLTKALSGANMVIITAGPPSKSSCVSAPYGGRSYFSSVPPGVPFTSRNHLLEASASVVGPLIQSCGIVCPKALIMIVSNPVNALVPFAAEILKKQDSFDARRLFGVTTLDVIRAETFLAEMLRSKSSPEIGSEVDVVGGHSAETIVPLFSQADLAKNLSSKQLDSLTYRECFVGFLFFRLLGISTHTSVGEKAPSMAAPRYTWQRTTTAVRHYRLPMLPSGTL